MTSQQPREHPADFSPLSPVRQSLPPGDEAILFGAIVALSITFAARIMTDRNLAPEAPPAQRRIATAAAAAVPIFATVIGGLILAPFVNYRTGQHLGCLAASFDCNLDPAPEVVVAFFVAFAILIVLLPLPTCILMKGGSRARLNETIRASTQALGWLRVVGVLLLASAVLNIPMRILGALLGDESMVVGYVNAATQSLLSLVLACSAIALARAQAESPATEAPQRADDAAVNRQKSAVPRLPSMSWKESARSRSTPEEQARNQVLFLTFSRGIPRGSDRIVPVTDYRG